MYPAVYIVNGAGLPPGPLAGAHRLAAAPRVRASLTATLVTISASSPSEASALGGHDVALHGVLPEDGDRAFWPAG
jgi:hypothetical protein